MDTQKNIVKTEDELFEESRKAFFNQYPDAKGYKCGFENIKKVDFEFTSEKLKNMIKKEKDESNE